MKKNRMLLVGVVGAVLVIQSTFWEFARMRPDFNFIVEPWSMRGTEMVHGDIYVAIGIALLAGLVAVTTRFSEQPAIGAGIAILIAAAAVVITALFVDRDVVITFSFIVQAVVAIVAAIVLHRVASTLIGEDRMVGWTALGVTAAAAAVAFIVAFVVLSGTSLSVGAPVAMIIAMVPVLALALSGQPAELIANRMMVMMAFIAILALGLQAGAIRQTLVNAQAALGLSSPADYKDTQVTSGYFWAQLGALMVFVSAVAQWAARRDHILNVRRARRQRAAAEASAKEIQDALEAAGLAGPASLESATPTE